MAVYIDFDNVVISRYEHVHGKGSWGQDSAWAHGMTGTTSDPIAAKLAEAKVDLGALIDYATSFGVVAMTRAYADWSVRANAAYRKQLVNQTIDLVQLFPVSGTKNGADIRLAVDAVDDLSRHPDITHVVLVAGDSDYSDANDSDAASSESVWRDRRVRCSSARATSSRGTKNCPASLPTKRRRRHASRLHRRLARCRRAQNGSRRPNRRARPRRRAMRRLLRCSSGP